VSHANLAANTHGIMVDALQCRPGDVGLNWLPLFHDMGLIGFVLAPLRYRIPIVHMSTASFVARPSRWAQALARHRATISFAPNFAYELAVRRTPQPEQFDLSHVRVLGCGAEPIQPSTLRAFLRHFAAAGLRPEVLMSSYGMAEATLAVSFARLGDGLRSETIDTAAYQSERMAQVQPAGMAGTEFVDCGTVLPGHRVRVLDDAGDELPDRRVGHVMVEGPSVTEGYWEADEQTRQAFPSPGVLRTGDLGYLAGGRLFVTGRQKDLIIVNGRNIDPQDVEKSVESIAGIKPNHVIAFSVPGPESELLVLAAASRTTEPDVLQDAIRRSVFRDMSLRVHDIVLMKSGDIPRTSSGKLQRAVMKQRYLRSVQAMPAS
jgi:fatty-acyl-CoA synthase